MKPAHPDEAYLSRPDNTRLDHLPGDYGRLPYLGRIVPLVQDPAGLTRDYYRRYGPVCRLRTIGQKMVWALGPEFNQRITVDTENLFSARMGYNGVMRDFFAGGLLMKDFAEHRFHRRIMQTAFRTDALRRQMESINARVEAALPAWPGVADFRFYPAIKALLLDVAATVFVGLTMEGKEAQRLNSAFLDMMAGVLSIVRKDWPGLLYHRAMNGRRTLEDFLLRLIAERRQGEGDDMMSHFARATDEEGQPYPDRVVCDHMVFLLLAAHDTATSALTMAAYYLARHPQWQERLREEALGLTSGPPGFDDTRNHMPQAEQVFHEVLRLHPPVPQLMRRTVRDCEMGGFDIPADTLVAISPIFSHRMDAYWRDPDAFDPDRFAPQRAEHKGHPYLWVPFGGGAHKCIGMHFADVLFKGVVHAMVRRYRWTLPEGYAAHPRIQHFPFAKLQDDLPLRFSPLH